MIQISRQEILERLHEWNPWWGGTAPAVPAHRRPAFEAVFGGLRSGKVQVLAGPRQTGKTTLLRQLAERLQASGAPARRVLYLPLDEFQDELAAKELTLRDLARLYSEEVAREALHEGEKFLLLDEAHVYPGWAREVKLLHDRGIPLRLAVSGSAAADVLAAAARHLAGRCVEHPILPMLFGEVLGVRLGARLGTEAREAAAEAFESCLSGDARRAAGCADGFAAASAGVAAEMRAGLADYLRRGGFPEPALKGWSEDECDQRLRAFVEQMIRRDFVDFFRVRDTRTFERLLRLLARNTGRILVERKMASDLGVSINTVRNHIGFLERVFVVFSARAFRASAAGQARLPEKYFFVDPGLRNALAGFSPQDLGPLLETAVYCHLRAYLAARHPAAQTFYWRRGGEEVDLVIRDGRRVLGIEVHAGGTHARGLEVFLNERPEASALLVSESPSAGGRIARIPPHLLLLLPPR